jgi:hypothetical protein
MSYEFLVSESGEVKAFAYLTTSRHLFSKGRTLATKALVSLPGEITQLKTQNSKLNIHPQGV